MLEMQSEYNLFGQVKKYGNKQQFLKPFPGWNMKIKLIMVERTYVKNVIIDQKWLFHTVLPPQIPPIPPKLLLPQSLLYQADPTPDPVPATRASDRGTDVPAQAGNMNVNLQYKTRSGRSVKNTRRLDLS